MHVPADRQSVSPSRFAQQLRLDAGADGGYRVEVDEIWNCPLLPHGGLVAALAARAMETELDRPEQLLRFRSPQTHPRDRGQASGRRRRTARLRGWARRRRWRSGS